MTIESTVFSYAKFYALFPEKFSCLWNTVMDSERKNEIKYFYLEIILKFVGILTPEYPTNKLF